jgi:Pyruvate/2-oxoacid:ferredoxin oxidoreductase gamma subunit
MKTFNLKIYSLGGQGVKSMVTKLEKALEDRQDLFFTSLVKYDGVIKGGMVETNIVISEKKGRSPFFKRANICILLTNIDRPSSCQEILEMQSSEILQKKLEQKVLSFFV